MKAESFSKKSFSVFWHNNKSFFIFAVLMLVFRSACADWSTVPTGSMKPTILEGDRIAINKMAYDLRVPFTHVSLMKFADPGRGDIVVFDSKAADKRLVKRVIGLPGDRVSMVNNQLVINGVAQNYETIPPPHTINEQVNNVDELEHFSNLVHRIRISNPNPHYFANFPTVVVPEGQYLMLGDNRDNSADSRVIGFVPRNEIVGRSRSVIMSLNYDNFYLPRSDRFFTRI